MDQLVAAVQHYAWGDVSFIAELQERVPSGAPEAELWMGAHPRSPSALRATGVRLDAHIAQAPHDVLGDAAAFGTLPFLAKVLAAAQPLSIQAHPSADQAAAGYAREEAAGIPLDSPARTYRDPNHKPELICALTPFDAKCGFRPIDASIELFQQIGGPIADEIIQRLSRLGTEADVLRDVVAWLLTAPADVARARTTGIVEACLQASDGPWTVDIGWTHRLNAQHSGDPGVVVALLLNHLTLEPGEALFLGAGVLHSYLQGAGVEVMANSDNVIRGGLTEKHIDVDELLITIDTHPAAPPVQRTAGPVHTFTAPVTEFALTRLDISGDITTTVTGPEILLPVDGEFRVSTATQVIGASPGQPVWIDAADRSWTAEGNGIVFCVSVPS